MIRVCRAEEVNRYENTYKKGNRAEKSFPYMLERECRRRGFSLIERNVDAGKK